jgi:hypothetical protein
MALPWSVRHLLTNLAAVGAFTPTNGRLVGTVAALVALAGALIAAFALIRRRGPGRFWGIAPLLAGAIGLVAGGWVVLTADGGPGTGNGVVGGFAALVLGLVATLAGWLLLARSRRAA